MSSQSQAALLGTSHTVRSPREQRARREPRPFRRCARAARASRLWGFVGRLGVAVRNKDFRHIGRCKYAKFGISYRHITRNVG